MQEVTKILLNATRALHISLLGLTTRDRREGNLMPRSFVDANTVPCGKFAFQCLICEKVIKYHEKIKRHLRDIHWTAGPSYLCPEDECKKTYTSRHAFAEHKRRKHPQWRGIALDKFIKSNRTIVWIIMANYVELKWKYMHSLLVTICRLATLFLYLFHTLLSRSQSICCWKCQADLRGTPDVFDMWQGAHHKWQQCLEAHERSPLVWGALVLLPRARLWEALQLQRCLQKAQRKASSGVEESACRQLHCQKLSWTERSPLLCPEELKYRVFEWNRD